MANKTFPPTLEDKTLLPTTPRRPREGEPSPATSRSVFPAQAGSLKESFGAKTTRGKVTQLLEEVDQLALNSLSARVRAPKTRIRVAKDIGNSANQHLSPDSANVLECLALDKHRQVRGVACDEIRKLADCTRRALLTDPATVGGFATLLQLARNRPADCRQFAFDIIKGFTVCTSTPVRRATADALGAVLATGPEVPGVSMLLPELTKDKYFSVRERTAVALGKALATNPHVPGIFQALQRVACDPDVRVRAAAIDQLHGLVAILGEILTENPTAPGALDILITLAHHELPNVRELVPLALCKIPPIAKTVRDNAAALITGAEASMAEQVVARKEISQNLTDAKRRAAKTPDPKAKPADQEKAAADRAEAEALCSELETLQVAAVEKESEARSVLEKCKGEKRQAQGAADNAYRTLMELVKDNSAKVRQNVAKALGNLTVEFPNVPSLFEALQDLMTDANDDVLLEAASALRKSTQSAVPSTLGVLLKLTTNESWKVRQQIATLLGIHYKPGGARACDIIEALQIFVNKDKANEVRSAAASALRGLRVTTIQDGETYEATIKKLPAEDPLGYRRWMVQFDSGSKVNSSYVKSIRAIEPN